MTWIKDYSLMDYTHIDTFSSREMTRTHNDRREMACTYNDHDKPKMTMCGKA